MATTIGDHEPIKIKRNTNGDTRVAKKMPTIEEFDRSNRSHRVDVDRLIDRFCKILRCSATNHDWTKVTEPYRSMFYRDMSSVIEHDMDFFDGEWSKLHYYELERHHLKRHCPDDVDLFDVIEMICDCVAAGMARSGEVYDLDIQEGILTKAVQNTVKILKDQIQVEEMDEQNS